MPEGERGRLRSREADHSQKGADGTKSKSYEGARIKETGLGRRFFFHGDFPLLGWSGGGVKTVVDNSKTSARPDAFFPIIQKQPPKSSLDFVSFARFRFWDKRL
jgi:hypothetical protein